MAVILAGTGSSVGAQAVRTVGGFVIAQEPLDAAGEALSGSAINAKAYRWDRSNLPYTTIFNALVASPEVLKRMANSSRALRHVRNRTGHGFSQYKAGTLLRRIALRMSVLCLPRPSNYLKRLADDPEEAQRLFQEVLINVTSFFRDQEVFNELRDTILPDLVKQAGTAGNVRIWAPGPPARLDMSQLATPDHDQAETKRQAGTAKKTQPFTQDIMAHFSPPYMAVNAQADLLFASQDATRFLKIPVGKPQLNIMKLNRPALEPTLRSLLRRDQSAGAVHVISFSGDIDGAPTRLRISCKAVEDGQMLLVFSGPKPIPRPRFAAC